MNGRLGGILAAALAAGGAAGAAPAGPDRAPAPAAAGTPRAWLAAHAAARAGTLAGVTLRPAPAPALPALAWSASAAAVAQAWASRCTFAHNPDRGADGTPRGENLAAGSPGRWRTPAAVVASWGAEWSDYDHAGNRCAPGRSCGHYTQLVWRGTLRVGCAAATCTVNSPFGAAMPTWELFVCDYEPAGNVVGRRPY